MTLFSWYKSSKPEQSSESQNDVTSNIDSMWPTAKVRKNTQIQQQNYIDSNQSNEVNSHTTGNKHLLP